MGKRRSKDLDRERAVSVENASPPVQAPLELHYEADPDYAARARRAMTSWVEG